jgi:alpha-ribazole phosphatase
MTPNPVSPAPPAPASDPASDALGRLWLVRHARVLCPVEPARATCYGRLDWPADPLATQELARTLAGQLPIGARLRSSTRQRTRLLAHELQALRPDLQPGGADARLDELDFGAWEGRRWDDIGEAAVAAWVRNFADARVGGGESVRQLLQRVQAALIEQAADGPGEVVWLCHAGVIRACLWLYGSTSSATPQADTWPRTTVSFAYCKEFPRTYPRTGELGWRS